jgi:hypothetical protein
MGYINNGGGPFDNGGNRLQGGSPPRGGGSNPIGGGSNGLLRSGSSRPSRDHNRKPYAARSTRSWIGCT